MTGATPLSPTPDGRDGTEDTGSTDGTAGIDARAIATARVLAMDAVQQVGNGHPGTAMALAPIAHHLFQKVMVHDPADPRWLGRDRFVLSMGHASVLLYIQLYLCGYGLTLDDLKSLRTWGSATPGHPEWGHTAGVETTTGPLGQGIANAVGMALAARRERHLLDPSSPAGESIFDHRIWVLASDGDIQEGVSAEASSLAGHQGLGQLTVIYDANDITIEGGTNLALSEDVGQRYEAYGWHVERVDRAPDGDINVVAFDRACQQAKAHTERPSLIIVRSTIAWPAPHAQGTSAAHGAALGADEVAATKRVLGFDPAQMFEVPPDVLSHTRLVADRGARSRQEWNQRRSAWTAANPLSASLLQRLEARELPNGWTQHLPDFEPGAAMATRKASGLVINALARVLPELWGGSADLGESNNTVIKDADSAAAVAANNSGPGGRVLHFGIREHAMASAMNGIALHGRSRVFGGTFLVFSDYMRPAVRLAALMGLPVTYIWTHDSIGVGEDGPKHQPVEHLAALRAIPNLTVIRPADAGETAAAWRVALTALSGPTALILTRQDVPVLDRTAAQIINGGDEPLLRGGYIISDAVNPQVIVLASGSEVALALSAQALLAQQGISARVVSMASFEIFEQQSAEYRESVLPSSLTARVSVEAGITDPWRRYVGDHGISIGIDHYGASAAAGVLFEKFGITAEAVAQAATQLLSR